MQLLGSQEKVAYMRVVHIRVLHTMHLEKSGAKEKLHIAVLCI